MNLHFIGAPITSDNVNIGPIRSTADNRTHLYPLVTVANVVLDKQGLGRHIAKSQLGAAESCSRTLRHSGGANTSTTVLRQNPGNAMCRYFDAWVPTEVRVRVRVWVGDSILDRRFEIAVPRKSGTHPWNSRLIPGPIHGGSIAILCLFTSSIVKELARIGP